MAPRQEQSTDLTLLRSLRRLVLGVSVFLLFALILFWRIDNPRAERLRMAMVDRVLPPLDWLMAPVNSGLRMVQDFQSYERVYRQNQELRDELRAMQIWREAALQLEQENARLLALNNMQLTDEISFISGQVAADSGTPFRQSVLVNLGRRDGLRDGWAVTDGFGLVGRIAGLGEESARVVLLTDSSSHIPAVIHPSGQRVIVSGKNTALPAVSFYESREQIQAGDRVVTSGDGLVFPPDLLIGQVVINKDGLPLVRPAAEFRRLEYLKILRSPRSEAIDGTGAIIGARGDARPEGQDAAREGAEAQARDQAGGSE